MDDSQRPGRPLRARLLVVQFRVDVNEVMSLYVRWTEEMVTKRELLLPLNSCVSKSRIK